MYQPFVPHNLGITILDDIPLEKLVPYIDWRFFFSAWKLTGRYDGIDTAICDCGQCANAWLQKFAQEERAKATEALNLYKDGLALLKNISEEKKINIQGFIGIFPAVSQNEGIVFFYQNKEIYLPTLRQQAPNETGNYLSLCDFVSPQKDYAGTFAVTVHGAEEIAKTFDETGDNYNTLLIKSLADRIAEAAAEWLHEQIRKRYWGYAANEDLSIDDMLRVRYSGIRPAIGYPSLPDQSVIFDLQPIMPFEKINIQLTENGAMYPNASVCGIVISHPKSKYFAVGKIDEIQLKDYAARRNKSIDEIKKFLLPNILK